MKKEKAKENFTKLKYALSRVDIIKTDIAKKRDELRAAVEDVNQIVESMDEAIDGLDSGVRDFQRAVDSLSQYL